MAMTKREQAEMQALRDDLAAVKALAWPTCAEPVPMMRQRDAAVRGYVTKEHILVSGSVHKCHAEHGVVFLEEVQPSEHDLERLENEPMYATEAEAWLALRFALCRRYGKRLAEVLAKCP